MFEIKERISVTARRRKLGRSSPCGALRNRVAVAPMQFRWQGVRGEEHFPCFRNCTCTSAWLLGWRGKATLLCGHVASDYLTSGAFTAAVLPPSTQEHYFCWPEISFVTADPKLPNEHDDLPSAIATRGRMQCLLLEAGSVDLPDSNSGNYGTSQRKPALASGLSDGAWAQVGPKNDEALE